MITTILIGLGLAILPFITILGFPGNESMIMFGLFMASTLCLWGYFTQEQKPLRNRWLLFFIGYLLFSAWQSPSPVLVISGLPATHMWVWKPIFMAFVYLGMYKAIVAAKITEKHKDIIFDILIVSGLITAFHCIGQRFDIMQWFALTKRYAPEASQGFIRVTGMLGAPTFVSPYMMMIIPLALFRKRYLFAAVMALAIYFSRSQMAMGAGVVMLGALGCFKFKRYRNFIIGLFMIVGITLASLYLSGNSTTREFIQDSARFTNWSKMAVAINSPSPTGKKYPYTGRGPGSFYYTYRAESKTAYARAHNEYLEVLYDTGIIGAFLFIMSLFHIFKNIVFSERNKYLLASFIGICVCALGTFVWHLGATMFLTIVILGLLNNEELKNG